MIRTRHLYSYIERYRHQEGHVVLIAGATIAGVLSIFSGGPIPDIHFLNLDTHRNFRFCPSVCC